MESVSVCALTSLKACPARTSRGIKLNTQVSQKHAVSQQNLLFLLALCVKMNNVLQVRDLQFTKRATGPAGLPGPLVVEGNTGGPAAATPKDSLKLHAEETATVKDTAEKEDIHLLNMTNQCLSNSDKYMLKTSSVMVLGHQAIYKMYFFFG